ncbi:hypothetical protein DUNSADRAFT_7352 [Dunaliella salina]|uniref:Encoded protein n=1 Tax=Dunaliella salina TaxID=3046 RepID=A0ABQ7GLJ3_DUNSA|nr:hypothetical protein DUNSADRAFT_7352 [Dunaliella salina]|eukprot:KAF5835463.1 hypothetical protein DUNSADRAFT_7352 [Dunaliella salina]
MGLVGFFFAHLRIQLGRDFSFMITCAGCGTRKCLEGQVRVRRCVGLAKLSERNRIPNLREGQGGPRPLRGRPRPPRPAGILSGRPCERSRMIFSCKAL